MFRKWHISHSLFIGLYLVLSSCSSTPAVNISPDEILSAHTFTDIEGKPVDIKDHLGKPLLIAYWATWCRYCKKDRPALEEFKKKRGRSTHIVMLSDEKPAVISKYLSDSEDDGFTHLLSSQSLRRYGITQRPSYAYFSAEGNHLETINGSVDFKMLIGMQEYHKQKNR